MEKFYKKRIYRFIAVIGLIILLAYSCKKDEPQPSQPYQELFWVTNKGAQMPVLMTGNKESASIVLFIHGGPGSCMIAETGIYTLNPSGNLSDNYLLAMWDQRYAGYSINPDPIDWSTVNVEQYAEDCARVTDQLKIRFPGKKIIVCGHSWGGAVLVKFISNSAYQGNYDGWVVADGMVNGYDLANAWLSYARRRCNDLIAGGNIQFIDTLAYLNSVKFDPSVHDKPTCFRVQNIAYSLVIPGEKPIDPEDLKRWSQLEKSIFPGIADQNRKDQNGSSQANLDLATNQVYFINSSASYANISKPGLIVWGVNDYVVPPDVAYSFTAKLDSLGKAFEFKLYPDCWHALMISNRDQYVNDIKNFIDGL
jgi:pimeloyl-ACP methyl ester carboxylesterase